MVHRVPVFEPHQGPDLDVGMEETRQDGIALEVDLGGAFKWPRALHDALDSIAVDGDGNSIVDCARSVHQASIDQEQIDRRSRCLRRDA